jgi:hypothetical protein
MLEAPWADDTDQNPTVRQTQHRPLKSSAKSDSPVESPCSNMVLAAVVIGHDPKPWG